MNRRELIRYTALATGVAVCSPLVSTLLSGCSTKEVAGDPDYMPQFFDSDEFSLVRELVDVILPKTDTPSASEVGVHRIIDAMVGTVYRPHEKEAYRQKFDALAAYLRENDFQKIGAEEKLALLAAIGSSSDDVQSGFLELKQQTVAFYLSTEEIATQYLNYLPVPGKYEPCISLNEVNNKAWAI